MGVALPGGGQAYPCAIVSLNAGAYANAVSVSPHNYGADACILTFDNVGQVQSVLADVAMTVQMGTPATYTAAVNTVAGCGSSYAVSSSDPSVATVPSSVAMTLGQGAGGLFSGICTVSVPITPKAVGTASLTIAADSPTNTSDEYLVPITVVAAGSSPSPSPSTSPTAMPTGAPTAAPTAAPTPAAASNCIPGSFGQIASGSATQELFFTTPLTSAAQAACAGLNSSAPNQIQVTGPSVTTTLAFNFWNGAPYGIVVPSTAVAHPQVLAGIELIANPAASFPASSAAALFLVQLTLASAPPPGTYYVGYCQENASQTACTSGSAMVDQPAYVSATSLGTNGITTGSISVGGNPYLIEIYH